jgi:hypothetical protein
VEIRLFSTYTTRGQINDSSLDLEQSAKPISISNYTQFTKMKYVTVPVLVSAVLIASASSSIAEPESPIKVGVLATYNTKGKSVSPTVQVSQKQGSLTYTGWANFRRGAVTKPAVQASVISQTVSAAYSVEDARDRFGIEIPRNYLSPAIPSSEYNEDGTRKDGQPISGLSRSGKLVTASATTKSVKTSGVAEEREPDATFGFDVKADVYQNHGTLVSMGVGVKLAGQLVPYVAAQIDSKLQESISFFADIKVPLDSSGTDIGAGIKFNF